jgi:O-succinylbenzoate synthase
MESHRHPDADRTAWWQERLARVSALVQQAPAP